MFPFVRLQGEEEGSRSYVLQRGTVDTSLIVVDRMMYDT
jgi:hypothetical protein